VGGVVVVEVNGLLVRQVYGQALDGRELSCIRNSATKTNRSYYTFSLIRKEIERKKGRT
jgi:hypothetical protein